MKLMKIAGSLCMLLALVACHSHKQQDTHTHSHKEVDDYFGAYTLADPTYGTETVVVIEGQHRVMETNALPNHNTGDFPNAGNPNRIRAQNRRYTIPLEPTYTGVAKWAREPGVALNGVKFEPETAEVVECASGERYRVEAVQDLIDLGLDHHHAHVQPTGAYHYHGTPTGVVKAFDQGEDLVHIGFAMDGFPIYYSKSGAYRPSYRKIDETREGTDCTYENPHVRVAVDLDGTHANGTYVSDWEYVPDLGDLDECNGITIDGEYRYLVTDDYPFVGRCLMGEFVEARRPMGPPPGGRPPRGRRPNGRG
ncbi:MAG: YHYH protein [Bacteroidota bacterium]